MHVFLNLLKTIPPTGTSYWNTFFHISSNITNFTTEEHSNLENNNNNTGRN